ncbi:serine/threonine-protein kinase rio2-like [Hibiscus syriacus]|uniref:serine/threonine-protein kinase rio2-like n=1 Tax=Hibiscus syriacus TaxID=106335 RepID=UPI00192276BE|nr:serine/threonine-protein kinase rio2-like [Hibiscus syriacus]
MKLYVDVLRYISKDDFRVHRLYSFAQVLIVDGGTYKVLKNLLKHKLVHHYSSKYDGFRLTYLGYDFLAIKTMVNRGVFTAVGCQIGVGKESGNSFYLHLLNVFPLPAFFLSCSKQSRTYTCTSLIQALEEHGFPVPNAVDSNRHCVVMSLFKGYPLFQVKQLQNPETVFETIIGRVVRLAEHGLIHCDFNEFSLQIDDDEKVTMIDFPLMVSVSISHLTAQMYNADDLMGNNKTIQEEPTSSFNEEDQVEENLQSSEAGRTCDPEGQNSSNEEDDEQKGDEYETELVKSLAKQRRRAMAASRKGHKNTTSRNSYKDKGGKSSNNSKIQKQLGKF